MTSLPVVPLSSKMSPKLPPDEKCRAHVALQTKEVQRTPQLESLPSVFWNFPLLSVFWNSPLRFLELSSLSLKDKNKGLSLWFFFEVSENYSFYRQSPSVPFQRHGRIFFSLNSGSPRVVDRSVIRPHVEKNSRFFLFKIFFSIFFLFKFFFRFFSV